jgi:hypothetical protein
VLSGFYSVPPQVPWRQIVPRCILQMMCSSNTDPELRQRLRWASESGNTSAIPQRAGVAFVRRDSKHPPK